MIMQGNLQHYDDAGFNECGMVLDRRVRVAAGRDIHVQGRQAAGDYAGSGWSSEPGRTPPTMRAVTRSKCRP